MLAHAFVSSLRWPLYVLKTTKYLCVLGELTFLFKKLFVIKTSRIETLKKNLVDFDEKYYLNKIDKVLKIKQTTLILEKQ